MTVKAFAEKWLLPEQHDYVVVEEGKLAGIVSLSLLRYLPPQRLGAHFSWQRTAPKHTECPLRRTG